MTALKYVPLQKAFCHDLKRHEDYIGVLKLINPERLAFPHSFFVMLLAHWFEWLCQVVGNIWSYEDTSRVFDNKCKAQALRKEAQKIREEWFEHLSDRISEFLVCIKTFINPEEIAPSVPFLANNCHSEPLYM